MKHLLSILLVTLICSCNSTHVSPDWDKLSLCGNVKNIKETSFSVTTLFGDYVKSDYNIVAMNMGFPCNSRNITFDKHGKIVKVINSYGDDMVQKPIYDSSYNLLGEYMEVNGKLIYRRQYDINSNISEYVPRESLEYSTVNQYKDLYSGILFARSDIHVDQFDNTRMNFCDTIVIVKEFNKLFNTWEIERVNFYNERKEQILYGELSLWGEYLYSYTYDDNGKIKFKHFPGGVRERYNFDKDGRIIESFIYYSNGELMETTEFVYDVKGLLVKQNVLLWAKEDNRLTPKIKDVEYQYDSNDKLVRFIDPHHDVTLKYDKTGYMTTFIDDFYTYDIIRDSVGLVRVIKGWDVATIKNSSETLCDKKYEYSYYPFDNFSIKNIKETDWSIYSDVITTYDSRGNWVSKLCFVDEYPQVFYERTIEYYK